MRTSLLWLAPAAALGLPLALAGFLDEERAPTLREAQAGGRVGDTAVAQMRDQDGDVVGEVRFTQQGAQLKVVVELEGLDVGPGFYGFHLHESGRCDAQAEGGPFTTAGSHYDPGDDDHGQHAGDFPPVLVSPQGKARLSFTTPRITLRDLLDDDGTAAVLHVDKDNLAHIPSRYRAGDNEAGPDEETRETGDSGNRFACGVVRGR
jgi:superoxide dismutase, Cu-Zn family